DTRRARGRSTPRHVLPAHAEGTSDPRRGAPPAGPACARARQPARRLATGAGMTPTGSRSVADRVYGALLLLYPSPFRARFEPEMRDTFARDHAGAQAQGARSLARFWTRAIAEAVRFGLAERVSSSPRTISTAGFPRRASMSSRLAVDWRDAWRSLRATPLVPVMATLSLALGIGANTALFSILNSLVLRTLPVRNPQELTVLLDGSWTNPIWEQIRDRQS